MTEITIPTFSMAQGVKYPGVVFLDLSNQYTLSTQLCWLPDQITIFIFYGYLFSFTICILLLFHFLQARKKHIFQLSKEEMGLPSVVLSSSKSSSFFYHVKEIAILGLPTYIICIFLL